MARRPIQVYLEDGDRELLDRLAARHGLSMAETIRAALRRWANEGRATSDPILALIGTMDAKELPADLSTRHDEYAVYGHARMQGRVAERAREGDG